MTVSIRPRLGSSVRCAVCHDAAAGARPCRSCGALAHDDCLALAVGCPTLGCSRASSIRRRARRVPELPRWYRSGTNLIGSAVLALAAVALVVGASQPFYRHLEEVPPHMEIDHGIIQSHPQSECAERGCPGRIQ